MKELSIEEKAKRYDEAIKIAKEINNEQRAQPFNVMTRVFPELKESKNEGIREALLNYLKEASYGKTLVVSTLDYKRWADWLEKQGEQKPYGQRQECSNCQFNYAGECKGSCAMKRGEQKPAVEMKTPEESLGIDSDTYNKIVDDCIYGEQKPAWSEEDEYTLGETIQHLEELIRIDKAKHCGVDVQYYQRDIDWLKSLRPKSTWKPSDEQMDALKHAFNDGSIVFADMKILATLYEQLKALHRYE